MPVLQLFAGAMEDSHDKLLALCLEVSRALYLEPGDVVATLVVVAETVIPGHDNAAWPVVVIYGSRRAPDTMADACERVRSLVASWTPGAGDNAWVTWQPPTS